MNTSTVRFKLSLSTASLLVAVTWPTAAIAGDCDFCPSHLPEGTEFVELLFCSVHMVKNYEDSWRQLPGVTIYPIECGSCTSSSPDVKEPPPITLEYPGEEILCTDRSTRIYCDDSSVEIVDVGVERHCAQYPGGSVEVQLRCEAKGCEKKKLYRKTFHYRDLNRYDLLFAGVARFRRISDGTIILAGCNISGSAIGDEQYILVSKTIEEERSTCTAQELLKCECDGTS